MANMHGVDDEGHVDDVTHVMHEIPHHCMLDSDTPVPTYAGIPAVSHQRLCQTRFGTAACSMPNAQTRCDRLVYLTRLTGRRRQSAVHTVYQVPEPPSCRSAGSLDAQVPSKNSLLVASYEASMVPSKKYRTM